MIQNYNEAVNSINNYILKCGGSYANWYVGIASSPRDRLFTDHSVNEQNDYWIYIQCPDSDIARRVEDYFDNILGTEGDTGGGNNTTVFVYAHKITNHSRE